MFGVVPRVLWEKVAPPDDLHRILLATRTLLAVHHRASRIVLVDTGVGTKWAPDQAERYAVAPIPDAVDVVLQQIGASREDVSDVVATHLHFDHCGGMTDWADQPGGSTRLRYPRARHWVTRRHWTHAHQPTPRDRASFFSHDFAALDAPNVLALVDDPGKPADIPDVRWVESNGHTPGQLLPCFLGGSGSRDVQFVGDLVPTAAHLPPTWVMAYDLWPLTTLEERTSLWKKCREVGFVVAFPHDPKCGVVTLAFDKDRPRVSEVLA